MVWARRKALRLEKKCELLTRSLNWYAAKSSATIQGDDHESAHGSCVHAHLELNAMRQKYMKSLLKSHLHLVTASCVVNKYVMTMGCSPSISVELYYLIMYLTLLYMYLLIV